MCVFSPVTATQKEPSPATCQRVHLKSEKDMCVSILKDGFQIWTLVDDRGKLRGSVKVGRQKVFEPLCEVLQLW